MKMTGKIKKAIQYSLYILLTNVIYWCVVYYTYIWLAGYSRLFAYLGNLALIILGLALDIFMYKFYESKEFIAMMKKEKDIEKSYRLIQLQLDSFVSFKAVLYIFYILILVFSQIIDFYPALVSENINNFISANSYSILLLIAFDQVIGQFSKDRNRTRKISEKLQKDLTDAQEDETVEGFQ